MLRRVCYRNFGLMDSVRKMMVTPRAVVRDMLTPSGKESGPVGHSNLAFDEVSQEWQAAIVESPYEIQNSQALDTVVQNNFGTVDNPHVIFTGDVPFRFVGCSGAPNEDDYDGHEFLLFLLREGPLQRCPSCGQVYKLVRLRDEASEINDYYSSSLFGQDFQELGEADHFLQQNPIRAVLTFNYEHTLFEVRSDYLYSLANPDDHDRFLVDPAYRLERAKLMEEKHQVYKRVITEIEDSFNQTHGQPKLSINKTNYENLIKAEVAIKELDDHFRKVHKFQLRHMYDPQNHTRREARMLERAKSRLGDNITIYLNNFSEDEIKYEDYFETDNEIELAKELTDDTRSKAITDPSMKHENLNFQEEWTRSYQHDHSPIIQQKIFKFKYREALGTPEDHYRRESRMLDRMSEQLDRLQEKYDEYVNFEVTDNGLESVGTTELYAKEKAFYDELFRFNIQNYKNYFESDNEADIQLIEDIPNEARVEILGGFYLDELNKYFEKLRTKSVTIGEYAGDEEGLVETVSNVYKMTQQVLPTIQKNLDSYNTDEKTLRTLDKATEFLNNQKKQEQAQISDKSEDK